MRKNQVSIKVERFGDQVPPEAGTTHQIISVYADSNDFSAALFEAVHVLMDKVEGHVGYDETSSSIEVSNLGAFTEAFTPNQRQHAAIEAVSEMKRSIAQTEFELFCLNNAEMIVHIISTSEDKEEAIRQLQEEFNFESEFQAAKCFASTVFATKAEIRNKENQLVELTERLAIAEAQRDAIEQTL